jgi:DNA invertase Pin-like site-specific DNA recombinase
LLVAKLLSFASVDHLAVSGAFVFAKVRCKRVSFCQEFCEATGEATMKIGYARVSTLDQHLDLQLHALKKAGCTKIWREKVSGLSPQRPELQRLLDQLRTGDTVVVWKLDRIARSTRHLLEIMDTLREMGARFLIQERTTAGRIAAQQRGVRFGRPRKLNADQEKLARRLVSEGKGVPEIAHTFNVHPSTIYRLPALDA